jgi:hypothetical protein
MAPSGVGFRSDDASACFRRPSAQCFCRLAGRGKRPPAAGLGAPTAMLSRLKMLSLGSSGAMFSPGMVDWLLWGRASMSFHLLLLSTWAWVCLSRVMLASVARRGWSSRLFLVRTARLLLRTGSANLKPVDFAKLPLRWDELFCCCCAPNLPDSTLSGSSCGSWEKYATSTIQWQSQSEDENNIWQPTLLKGAQFSPTSSTGST